MLNRKLFRNIDFTMPLLAIILTIIGLIVIASATHIQSSTAVATQFLQRQITAAIVGILAMIIVVFFDYRRLRHYSMFIYGTAVLILFLNSFFATGGVAAMRSLQIGPLSFQPSELAKICLIIALAKVLSEEKTKITLLTIVKVLFLTFVPFVLILRVDLGTALVLWFILFFMLFVAGYSGKKLIIAGLSVSAVLFSWIFAHLRWGIWIPLKEYQLMRLLVFWNPSLDPFGYGYHLIQSKIAIGSGGLIGKGLFSGTQSRLNFLPEQHTDFIFSVASEEFGLAGGLIIISLYLFLIIRGLKIAIDSKDLYGSLIVIGVLAMFGFHILVNIGMTMGVLPITGLPLPFLSYGGSSLTTNFIAIGLIINVNMRRQKILF